MDRTVVQCGSPQARLQPPCLAAAALLQKSRFLRQHPDDSKMRRLLHSSYSTACYVRPTHGAAEREPHSSHGPSRPHVPPERRSPGPWPRSDSAACSLPHSSHTRTPRGTARPPLHAASTRPWPAAGTSPPIRPTMSPQPCPRRCSPEPRPATRQAPRPRPHSSHQREQPIEEK